MKDKKTDFIPHRLSHSPPRGALAGSSLASSETSSDQGKCATVTRVCHNTNWASGKRAGDGTSCLKIGTVNLRTKSRGCGEVIEMAARHR